MKEITITVTDNKNKNKNKNKKNKNKSKIKTRAKVVAPERDKAGESQMAKMKCTQKQQGLQNCASICFHGYEV